ncbi:Hypothetical protein I595_1776 [Croceitalea dokdonensis DOKDO 023]|uniref:Abasic site processing protein n=1 Tax=Croceitalea dokdonensis DOKDO 023 TaxID=1300341 RepID=A0A0P7AUF6_9FLAO|nr:Hypothetical protein I595_1776 [Croceitalea dokdonensis DOKDO 023]
MEKHLNRPFKYPHLYERQILINGLEESVIPIVAMGKKEIISFSIWGILPEGYAEDWATFQDICNTLNVPLNSMEGNLWYAKSLLNKRCLIPITGFFTSYLSKGVVYPYYFARENALPFCLAGIYNVLDDGFITSSMITCEADDIIRKVHNVGQTMPMILHQDLHSAWLQEEVDMSEIKQILKTPHEFQIRAHPIAREFYKNHISYDSMLEPVTYNHIPKGLS